MKRLVLLFSIVFFAIGVGMAQSYMHPDFSSLPSGWQNLDRDADGYSWVFSGSVAYSYSYVYNNGNVALTPNNWLISDAVDLSNATAGTQLTFYIAATSSSYYAEHYQVLLSTTTNTPSAFTTVLFDETLTSGGSWSAKSKSLDDYLGQTIYIAFVHNNCTDQYVLALGEPRVVGKNEIELYTLDMNAYEQAGSGLPVKAVVYNNGSDAIQSFDFTYSVNGGAEVTTDHITGINIAPASSYTATHSVTIPTNTTENLAISAKVSLPNAFTDATYDNESSCNVMCYENKTERKTLLEQFTTANCGNCPSATSGLSTYVSSRPNVIWLSHHAGYSTDGLTHSVSANQLTAFYNDGGSTYAPALMVDRTWWAPDGDPGPIFGYSSGNCAIIDKGLATPAFVTVDFSNASYDADTRQVSLTVSGELVNKLFDESSSLRLSLYVEEDNLKTTPGQQGSSLGTNYIHNHVMRGNISEVWGDQSLFNSSEAGTTYSKTYTYTIPTNFVPENLTFIAFVSRYNSNVCKRDILNANSVKIADFATLAIEENQKDGVKIFPNPASDFVTLETENTIRKIELLNMEGQLIRVVEGSENTLSVKDLSNGIYFLRCTTDQGISTQKLVKE